MERYICIHGHFYQPPRENAWLEHIEPQDSAYPFHDWNERIAAECYMPNGTSRILDDEGNVEKITNNYAHISFNFGPTLLAWLQEKEPATYRSILDADKESQRRFSGHGSAIAQAFNHTILPLSTARDKYSQILWGIRDFEHRFGRKPEGMWLPETAVDLEVLDIMAKFGIRFTILSPHQAKRTRRLRSRVWRDASGGGVDPSTPYVVRLPSKRRIAVFFYDGPISHAIAFERLLDRGEQLSARLAAAFSEGHAWPQIVHVATDGETYGHHHKYGEMALAYALRHIESNNVAKLTNYSEYLQKHPPVMEAEIRERTAWSCAHGLGRWNSNCGCNSAGHPDWNQHWRAPLRAAFDWLRDTIAAPFEAMSRTLLKDPWKARNDYISVILDRTPENVDRFFKKHSNRRLTPEESVTVLKLMEMQRHAMLMYTSCGWFFDELSGLETTQVIQYAARTLQLYEEISGCSLETSFLSRLSLAKSNIPEHKDAQVIYENVIRPAMVDRRKVAAHYALSSLFKRYADEGRVYCYEVRRLDFHLGEAGRSKFAAGRIRVTSRITHESEMFSFGAVHIGEQFINAGVRESMGERAYMMLKRDLADAFNRGDFSELMRTLDRHFGESTYSLRSIFQDDKRTILDMIMKSALTETETMYRQLFERHGSIMRLVSDLGAPLPRVFSIASEIVLNTNLRSALANPATLDFAHIRTLIRQALANNTPLEADTLAFTYRDTICQLSEQLLRNPLDLELMKTVEEFAEVRRSLPFDVSVWRSQNYYYTMLQNVFPEQVERALHGDAAAQEWTKHFVVLGRSLAMKVDYPVIRRVRTASAAVAR